MIKKFIKRFSIITAPMFILTLLSYLSVSRIPDKIYINEESKLTDVSLQSNSFLNKIKLNKNNLNIDFLGVIPIKSVAVHTVSNLELYPGGTSVGVKLSTNGVLVVGYSNVETTNGKEDSPGKSSGIELGDMILKVNGASIESSKDLINKVKSTNNEYLDIEILRGKSKLTKEVKLLKEGESYKLGLWVRDSTAGIGTLTFYHEDSNTFGALGHPITDADTNTVFSVKNGDKIKKYIKSAEKKIERICKDLEKGKIRKRGFNKFSNIMGKCQGMHWIEIEEKNKSSVQVDDDCIKCGLCTKICPMKNLDLVNGEIVQNNNCILCYRCVNACCRKSITVLIHKKPKTQYKGVN
jgi:stage IV sporulation protein B